MSTSTNSEIEVKFYLQDLKSLETRLLQAGAELAQPRSHEYNLRFDTPAGHLQAAQQVLRLRQDANGVLMTFKGPNEHDAGAVKRQEIELSVDGLKAAEELLRALGFQVTTIYEKYRTTYHVEGVQWMLDELPIGDFAEIEGPSGGAIRRAAEHIGLNWNRRISTGYLDVFAQLKQANGWAFRDLTFENFSTRVVSTLDVGLIAADQSIHLPKYGKDK